MIPVEPVYRTLLVLDVEQFGRMDRDDQVRVRLRRGLAEVLAQALADAGVERRHWQATSTGDGLLVEIDPAVPTAKVVRVVLERVGNREKTARSYQTLAYLYFKLGREADAARLFERALDAKGQVHGRQHAELVTLLEH